ncbi:MAG: FAD-binding oxidoreductase [Chloroflexia bacterium]|nr:FAD-binding oxidoreductase [Chloroflexia bacterium]
MPRRGTTRRTFVGLGSVALAWGWARPLSAASRRSPPRAQPVSLTGRVIWPQNPDYDEARLTFNTRYSRFPAGIVVCDNTGDVQNAVRWARQENIPLRARSGGHSYEAFSVVDDGLVIDVGGLNEITVDTARGEAVIGAGVRLLDLYRRLWEYGVALPAGTCPGVGIAGLTLGGGIGFLSRQYGLTCDNLRAVDLVDANGETLRASEGEHADLFWALRGGGGGNFGIATAFTFRVHPFAGVAIATVTWPWDDVAEVLDAWQRWAPFADERLTVALGIANPSAGVISATGLFTGVPDELPTLLAPLLGAGKPSAPQFQPLSFLAAAEQLAGPSGDHANFKNTSALADEPLSPPAIATLVDGLRAAPTASNLVGLFPLGGAIGAIDPAATAFPHRRALFDLQYQAYWWEAAEEQADIAWVDDLRAAMAPYTTGAYVNYIDADLPNWATAYYGDNLARLEQVKTAYDPDDVFNGPQSIP